MKKRRSERINAQHFDALHQLGILKARGGLLQDALQLFSEALRINPGSAEANLNLGIVLAESGRPEEALASYDKALAIRSAFAEALYARGNALQALKRHEEALASYDRALAIVPGRAEILCNRGNTLHDLKRFEDALTSYEGAIAAMPASALLHNNRGNTLRELGRLEEALESLDSALAIAPGYADALNNRGNTMQDLQRHEEALASYDLALASSPGDAVIHHGRGNALQELRRYEEALASYDKALAIRSNFVEALRGYGNTLQKLRRFEEAMACYDKALVIQPDYVEALNSRGIALCNLKQPEEALLSFNRALALKPEYAEAINSHGVALMDLKRHEEALASYDRALALKPDFQDALFNRGEVLRNLKRHEEAAWSYTRLLELEPDYSFAKGDLLHAKMLCCDFGGLTALFESIEKDLHAGKKSVAPFGFQAISSSAQDLRLCAEIFASEKCPRAQTPVWTGERYQNTKIRIGYVSGEFRHQATSVLIAGLFELHDKNCFELFAFDNGWDDASEIRGRINRAIDEIVDIRRLGDREAAAAIRQRQIDILVNLNGYFGEARSGIFSLRPSPVQVNYLGFPGTLGVDYMDYILADRHVIPAEHEACYTEKVVYLPDTYQVNDARRVIAERTPSRAEVGLPETGFVFCCFNNNYKITPAIFDRWMRLLTRVPGSVLWLLEDNTAVPRNLRREAELRGVAPGRLIFAPRTRFEDHLARHRLADLFLDTLPYNAHTTANDALWAGLPLLTCQGTTFSGRVAASLLNAIGLNELVTSSLDEYEALAVDLAMYPKRLAEIRSKLARNRGTYPLFNTDRFRRHIESAYTTMWERYQRGEPPRSFAVEAIDGD